MWKVRGNFQKAESFSYTPYVVGSTTPTLFQNFNEIKYGCGHTHNNGQAYVLHENHGVWDTHTILRVIVSATWSEG